MRNWRTVKIASTDVLMRKSLANSGLGSMIREGQRMARMTKGERRVARMASAVTTYGDMVGWCVRCGMGYALRDGILLRDLL